MNKEQIAKVTVMYPARQGFIMPAHRIQQYLTAQIKKPVQLEEQQNGHFTVIINGTAIYDCLPLQPSEIDQAEIIKILSRYDLPETTIPTRCYRFR